MRRPLFAVALVLTTGCVPRAYAPAVYGTVTAGAVAATGEWYAVEGWVRDRVHARMGRHATRPETWGLHAAAALGSCGIAALLAWTWDACVPGALASVGAFAVKEIHEWGHPHFSPVDGVMDVVAPAAVAGGLIWWRGLPAWEREP